MSASLKSDPDFAALHDDVAALRRDVASLIAHLSGGATSTAQAAAEHIDEGARRLYRGVVAEGEASVNAIGRQIEEQPLVAILIAVGLGYIGGRLLPR